MGKNLRLIIFGVIFVIVLAVIFLRGDQLNELIETVKRGSTLFLILAVATQLGKYFSQGGAYIECFHVVDEKIPFGAAIKLVFGTFFMNTVAPSLNLAGITLVVNDAGKRGIPTGRATTAALLMQVTIDTGFVIIMLIGFTILSFTAGLQPGWFLLGLAAVALVGSLVTVMIVGGLKPDLVMRVLHPITKLINRVLAKFKRGPIDEGLSRTVHQFSSAASMIVENPKKTSKAFLFSILASTCELACFVTTGLAFGVTQLEPLICGYVVATLFAMISFVPQGVGVVEAAVVVAFALFGIDQAAAMAVVLVYRSIVFWMPFLIGAVLIQRTKSFTERGKKTADEIANAPTDSEQVADELAAVESPDASSKDVNAHAAGDANVEPATHAAGDAAGDAPVEPDAHAATHATGDAANHATTHAAGDATAPTHTADRRG